jgi:hypothetical protein
MSDDSFCGELICLRKEIDADPACSTYAREVRRRGWIGWIVYEVLSRRSIVCLAYFVQPQEGA